MKQWSRLKRFTVVSLIMLVMIITVGAVTQIDLSTQAKGVLAQANGGTGQNSTAIFPTSGNIASTGVTLTSGQLITGAGTSTVGVGNLSGDVTTAGSTVSTVVRIDGTTVPTNSAGDQVLTTSASATGQWSTLPNGVPSWSTSTHSFTLASVLSGSFADNETPTGTIDGTNAAFTLAHTPSPAGSLQCFKNGQLMIAGGADLTLATATVTYVTAAKPKTGDVHICSYRF